MLYFVVVSHVLPVASVQTLDSVKRDSLIYNYFQQGYSYNEIIITLLSVHGISLCLRQLKRILACLGLKRRVRESPMNSLITAIEEELQHSGKCIGYRSMWRRLTRDHHLKVKRETVRILLSIIDPDGVARRKHHRLLRRKYNVPGPNFIWHVDGYDKIKPYGFPIHGAIDGFSRKILWLQVSSTNNDPAVIAWHYLSVVQSLGHVPRVVRSDLGTENKTLEFLQPLFRRECSDSFGGLKSFIYGKSSANQRIEAWWSLLRKGCIDWWMCMFKDLRDRGLYDGHNAVHNQCLQFCFMDLIQKELDAVTADWNAHTIRSQKHTECPTGKPDILYFSPELFQSHNYGTPIDMEEVNICKDLYGKQPPHGYSSQFLDIVQLLRGEASKPATVDEALDMYVNIIDDIDKIQ